MLNLWWGLVRFGFRLLYNELAFTYDTVSWVVSLGAWRCWQRTALKHLDSPLAGMVLELAHGTGNLQVDLRRAGFSSIGYDLSPSMGRIAQAKLRQQRLAACLARGQAENLPFADAVFAAVVSTFPTDFITQPETLHEVYRVLKDNGRFIIVPNAVLNGGGVTERGIEWLYRITGQRGGGSDDIPAFFAQFGFDARMLVEPCPRSAVTVIVARKKV